MSIADIATIFAETFGGAPKWTARAPGRVNLIGEHTDYNDGYVLPCAIDFETRVVAGPANDQQITVIAADFDNARDTFSCDQAITHSEQGWANYVRGVFLEFQKLGHQLPSLNLVISGNVPQGAGLSSSAALEVATATLLNELCAAALSKNEIALLCQRAENDFVGCQCGIMDQLISAIGVENRAALIDCRSLESELVEIPRDYSLLIVNSNVKRGLVDSEYNTRREQCEEASRALGINALRDATLEDLEKLEQSVSEEVFKRARHVITENERTVAMAKALAGNQHDQIKALMSQSHASMRDDFEITTHQIDFLVELIGEQLGEKGGVRMTGGGFGGCVVALCPTELIDKVSAVVERDYLERTGLTPDIFVCTAREGASVASKELG